MKKSLEILRRLIEVEQKARSRGETSGHLTPLELDSTIALVERLAFGRIFLPGHVQTLERMIRREAAWEHTGRHIERHLLNVEYTSFTVCLDAVGVYAYA